MTIEKEEDTKSFFYVGNQKGASSTVYLYKDSTILILLNGFYHCTHIIILAGELGIPNDSVQLRLFIAMCDCINMAIA